MATDAVRNLETGGHCCRLWADEIERLLATAHELPRAARAAVGRVLRSLLDEPDTESAAARDIAAALAAVLEPARPGAGGRQANSVAWPARSGGSRRSRA